MWEDVCIPEEAESQEQKEALIRKIAVEKMRAYDGTIFLCTARNDQARRRTFTEAAAELGLAALDGWKVFEEQSAEELAEREGRTVLFVEPWMQEKLGEYLNACPPARRLLLYARRKGNGPCPRMSFFMEFWEKQGVDIWDFRSN